MDASDLEPLRISTCGRYRVIYYTTPKLEMNLIYYDRRDRHDYVPSLISL